MSEELERMRREYAGASLRRADLATTWLEQLERWIDEAVRAELPEPNAMVLATADVDGIPSARTVLLKGLDDHGLTFFTNLRSRKGQELAANARAAVVFPWIELHRQVVVDGAVEPLAAAASDEYFASRPRGAQLGAAASDQSHPVASRADLEEAYREAEARHPGPGAPARRTGAGCACARTRSSSGRAARTACTTGFASATRRASGSWSAWRPESALSGRRPPGRGSPHPS